MVEYEICIPGGWKNVARQKRKRAKHRQYSACTRRSSLHQMVSRVCTSDERRFLYIICNSAVPSGVFLRVLACFSRTTTIPSCSFSVSLIHVRYARNLAVANSCTNVNAGRDGFTNCFSLPPPTADPFYVSSFFSLFLFLVPPLLPLSFALSLSSRIRGHEPYRGNSTFVFVFRHRRWQSRKNRQDERNGGKEKW